jgi:hypothetical protein
MWHLINVIVASGPWDSAASGDGWALHYYGNDGSPESKDEEIARLRLLVSPLCTTLFLSLLTTIYSRREYSEN